MSLIEPKARRWTKAEYHEAADLGWFDGQRVELIDGEVVEMPPQKDAHAFALRLAQHAVQKMVGGEYVLLVQMPLNLGTSSEPEPDLAVVRGSVRELKKHPKSAVLVVEVSDTTLGFDRGRKAALYASKGIRDYWIINLLQDQLEVRRRPLRTSGAPFGYGFGEIKTLRRSDSIAPLFARKALVKIFDLLP